MHFQTISHRVLAEWNKRHFFMRAVEIPGKNICSFTLRLRSEKPNAETLYQVISKIVGPVEWIKTRRSYWKISEFITNVYDFGRIIYSGSRAEGLDLPGSDSDTMLVFTLLSVYPSNETLQYSADTDLILILDNVRPGFALVKVHKVSPVVDVQISSVRMENGEVYLSSKLWREFFLYNCNIRHPSRFDILYLHGPCSTMKIDGIEHDFVCHTWPDVAVEWVNRRRKNNWPPNTLVQEVVESDCILIPVGAKQSSTENLEWRLSFSVAELKLIYSMNHIQFLCYGPLKMILRQGH
ncbi:hypothetical protein KUTeg_008523 [Tegillarca granosa]|uniref:Mab-21-like nucleotidyltransferase domain-containing protein n=1 Tax=Tegillarca granosa TaxID=220873 RepID=A0ABQ9FDM2_TEGGR|nr:hypothetical protein KUTeg_008523 [Tegillarca granosa]